MYSDSAPISCSDCWNGTQRDPFSNGKDYDFSRSFFDQLKELFAVSPRFFSYQFGTLVNSDFTNFSKDNKNAYLSYSVTDCEDVMYSETIDKSKNSMDCYATQKADGCSYNVDCEGNYNTHFAVKSQNCIDSYFVYDCSNCQNCYLSSNLRNQQYYFKNQKLSKEAYQEAIREYNLGSYSGFEKSKKEFNELILNNTIHKYAFIYSAQDVTGDYIHHAKNIKKCFDTNDAENIAYSVRAIEVKDSYDLGGTGFKAELIYESMAATANTARDFFCYLTIQGCTECEYSLILRNCTNCFACVGLINAKYCIFNKQYTKEEYEILVPQIKQHMMDMPYVDKKGRVFRYGEFFPYDMSPFGYNETNAHDFFQKTKEMAIESGFKWKDRIKREYAVTKQSRDLPDHIDEVDDSILDETISCPNDGSPDSQCTTAFKIVPNELMFYRQKKLPLPRYCPNCRHYDRLKYRNSMKLYKRECSNDCGTIFETTYSPDRPEKVFCEKCYQKEVL